jgi:histidine ammonia-lyase
MIEIDGSHLTLQDIIAIARNQEEVKLAPEALSNLERAQSWIQDIVESGRPVYGINTGFGIFADRSIPAKDSAQLSRNLILSHAVGTGPDLDVEIVRAAMLVRANTLSKGYSGVRPQIVQTLLEMINKGLTPIIPAQGSLGSSGDLGPLSHMALVFTTDEANLTEESGWATYQGERYDGKTAMSKAGIARQILGPKEGLAVNNGATFCAAIAALAIVDAARLLTVAEIALSMSLEAMLGTSNAFDDRLHQARGLEGQITVARHVRELTEGSTLMDAAGRVQDAYSLRCAPQVQGVARDTIKFVKSIIEHEINAATDNPLLFSAEDAISGGNFHGEPVGMVMDYLGIAMSEVAAISERRVFRLTDAKLNTGLPPMLVDSHEAAGLNSGLMMPQYTAASLVLENQTLASPDSVRSLPTSGEQEDHNANAMTAARHSRQIIGNAYHVLAIEIFTAAQAIDLRLKANPDAKLGKGVAKAHQLVREIVPYHAKDTNWNPDIEKIKALISKDEFSGQVLENI